MAGAESGGRSELPAGASLGPPLARRRQGAGRSACGRWQRERGALR